MRTVTMLRFLMLCGISAVILGKDIESYRFPVKTGQEKPWYAGKCGQSKYTDAGEPAPQRIIGGSKARPHEFPWQVSLRKRTYPVSFLDPMFPPKHICGGSIINECYIVTAAHCVVNETAPYLAVVVGEHTTSDTSNTFRKQLNVEKIVIHSQFDPLEFSNDIALLKVSTSITFNDNVKPVCKPDKTKDYYGSKAFVSGWGTTVLDAPCCPDTLMYAKVSITSNEYCQKRYSEIPDYPVIPITDDMICANDNKNNTERDSCQGDSGGPLTVKDPETGTFSLIGLVSWGFGCASGYPGVYTRVTYFDDWICKNIIV